MATYLTLDEYLGLGSSWNGQQKRLAVGRILQELPRKEFLAHLAILQHVFFGDELGEELRSLFRMHLNGDAGARFDNAFLDEHKVFLGRQPILRAMQLVLAGDEPSTPIRKFPPIVSAVLLSHAAGMLLEDAKKGESTRLAMDLFQNAIFNAREDVFSVIDRTSRLWVDCGARVSRNTAPMLPAQLLQETIHLDMEDLLAFGFALWANVSAWKPDNGRGFSLNIGFNSDRERATIERFVEVVAADFDLLVESATRTGSNWDFLMFETRPVWREGDELWVLDEQLLMQRITTGLYWFVFDGLKSAPFEGYTHLDWTRTFGEMVELQVEAEVETMKPPLFGEGSTFYTEEQIARAYAGKQCDCVVFFGSHYLLVEAVGGLVTVPTRIEGSVEQFQADTDKLVIKKARQLDATGRNILSDEPALTGSEPTQGVRMVPVIVTAGGYPVTFPTVRYVHDVIARERLLQHPRFEPLCIIDLGELEMLEGLRERGSSPVEILVSWQRGELREVPLRNYLIHFYGGGPDIRPERMKRRVDKTFKEVIKRLRLKRQAGSEEQEERSRVPGQ